MTPRLFPVINHSESGLNAEAVTLLPADYEKLVSLELLAKIQIYTVPEGPTTAA
jgi:hypothetical protein